MNQFDFESDSDDEFLEQMLRRVRKVKRIRPRPNNFEEWDDEEFVKRFRLTKLTALLVLDEIRDQLEHATNRNSALPPMNQLLLALRFYATGGTLTTAGDFCGVHKVTAGTVVNRVSAAIASLRRTYIKMPEGERECHSLQSDFYRLAAFPRTIGSLDCTHIRIKSPGGDAPEDFRNRKGYFSMNVQTVCDTKLRIRDIVARWPGSSHDSTIFNNSVLKARLERGDFGNSVLVCDSGYAPGLHLLPPLRNPATRAQQLYNESLIRTRNTVERQYGVWKARFPVLALGIRQKIENVQGVIVACAVLHNMAIDNNEHQPPLDAEVEDRVRQGIEEGEIQVDRNENNGAEAVRHAFIQHFERLL
ncbi:putative nuclease HARBI1 [Anabrus simplex]|uniref:putative nuclease HARBI1 n=1 Tax=Anabrus simplex TaxID=316456 RepID=UPI0035A3A5D2